MRGTRRTALPASGRLATLAGAARAARAAAAGAARVAAVGVGVGVVVVGTAGAPAALAAEWRFEPVLTALIEYNNDPLIVEDPDAPDAPSEVEGRRADESVSLDAVLTLTRRTPRSGLTLVGNPRFEKYNEQEQLDNVQWFASVGWDWDQSERTRYDALVGYTHWERARFDFTDPGILQPTVGGRTSYDTLAGRAGAYTEFGPRTRGNLGASYTSTSYESFEVNLGDTDGDGTDDLVPVEDSASLDLFAGLGYSLSPLSSAGIEVRASQLDEGLYGTRDVLRGVLSYRYGTADRWSIDLRGGYASSKADELGDFGSAEDASEGIGSLAYTRRVGHRPGGSFGFGASRDLTGSGGVLGLSLTHSAYASLTLPVAQFSSLRFVLNASRFEPIASTLATEATDSFGGRAEYALAFGPHWSAVASAEYQNQESAFSALTLDYYIVGVGVRWAPFSVREAIVNPTTP